MKRAFMPMCPHCPREGVLSERITSASLNREQLRRRHSMTPAPMGPRDAASQCGGRSRPVEWGGAALDMKTENSDLNFNSSHLLLVWPWTFLMSVKAHGTVFTKCFWEPQPGSDFTWGGDGAWCRGKPTAVTVPNWSGHSLLKDSHYWTPFTCQYGAW